MACVSCGRPLPPAADAPESSLCEKCAALAAVEAPEPAPAQRPASGTWGLALAALLAIGLVVFLARTASTGGHRSWLAGRRQAAIPHDARRVNGKRPSIPNSVTLELQRKACVYPEILWVNPFEQEQLWDDWFAATISADLTRAAIIGPYPVSGPGGRLNIVDLTTGELVHVIGQAPWFKTAAFSPDGKKVATVGATIEVWETETGKKLVDLGSHHGGKTRRIAFSPDGRSLASCGTEGAVLLHDLDSREVRLTLKTDEKIALCVAVSPANTVFAGLLSGKIVSWDLETGKPGRSYKADIGRVRELAFSLDGGLVAAGGAGVQAWGVRTGRSILCSRSQVSHATGLAMTPDGGMVIAAHAEISFHPIGKAAPRPSVPGGWYPAVAISDDQRRLAAVDLHGNIFVWDLTRRNALPSKR